MANSRRAWKRWLVPIGLLILISAPFVIVGQVQKKSDRAWMEFVAKWKAEGEKFDLQRYLPRPVADADNLARHPVMASFLEAHDGEKDWRQVLPSELPGWNEEAYLEYLEKVAGESRTPIVRSFGLRPDTTPDGFITHLGEGYQRWSATLDTYGQSVRERGHLWYDIDWAGIFVKVEMPDFTPYSNLAKAFLLRAAIRRSLRDQEGALADLASALLISQAYEDIPLLLSLVLQAGIHASLLDELRACLQTDFFNTPQLVKLGHLLEEAPNLPGGFRKALRTERALVLAFFEAVEVSDDPDLLKGLPNLKNTGGFRSKLNKKWMNANRLALCQDQQELFLGRGGQLADLEDWQNAMRVRLADGGDEFISPLGHLALAMFQIDAGFGAVMFSTDADLHRTRIAVALKQAQLETHPEKIEDLVPEFLSSMPSLDPSVQIEYAVLPDGSWRLRNVILDQEPDDWISK